MAEVPEVIEPTWFRYVLAVALTLALVGLIAYARGDDSNVGRAPERADVVVVAES